MDYYQCKRCGSCIKTTQRPSVSGCPNGLQHHWSSLGGQSVDVPKPQKKTVGTSLSKPNGTNTSSSSGGCIGFVMLSAFVIVVNIYRHFVPSAQNEPTSNIGGASTHRETNINDQSNRIPKAIPVTEPYIDNNNPGRSSGIPKALPVDESVPSTPTTSNMLHVFVVVGIQPGDSLNVRSSPTMTSVPLLQLRNGQEVQARGDSVFNGETEWIPIKVGGLQGWANRAFLMLKQ